MGYGSPGFQGAHLREPSEPGLPPCSPRCRSRRSRGAYKATFSPAAPTVAADATASIQCPTRSVYPRGVSGLHRTLLLAFANKRGPDGACARRASGRGGERWVCVAGEASAKLDDGKSCCVRAGWCCGLPVSYTRLNLGVYLAFSIISHTPFVKQTRNCNSFILSAKVV